MSDRPKVGPADPETRRKLLRETLDSEAAEGAQRRAAPKPKKKAKSSGNLSDALNPKYRRERRYGEQGQTVDEVVDRAVKGAKPDPY